MKKRFSKIAIGFLALLMVASLGWFGYNSFNTNNVPLAKAMLSPIPNPSILGFLPDVGTVNDVVLSSDGNTAYLASDPFGVVAVDVSNPAAMKVLASQKPFGASNQVNISPDGKLAVAVQTPRGTDIVDISNPTEFKVLSSIAGTSSDAVISGSTLYLAIGGEVKIYNISNPASPNLLSTITTPGSTQGLAISGTNLLIADGSSGFEIANVSIPANPSIIGSLSLGGGSARKITCEGNNAYIANSTLMKLQIINFSTPSAPILASELNTSSALNVSILNNIVSVSSNTYGLKFVDVSNPITPVLLSTYKSTDYQPSTYSSAMKSGVTFVATSTYGLYAINTTNLASPVKISSLLQKNRASQLAVNEANTVAVAAGSANGTDIIDISNIGKPSIVSSITGISSDAVISGNTLYLAVMGDIKIYNLSNPALPSLLSTITTPGSTSGVAISGASLLIADGASGFEVADVSNPSSPLLKPALNLGGGSATKIATQGNYAYVVNSSLTKLQIVNFDNISAPTLVSEVNTTLASNVAVQGNIVALSARNYGVKFIDVSVPASPTILSSYVPPSGYQAYPYSCAFKDNMVFVAIPNYGINVVDISNPSSPTSISTIKTVGARSDASASIDVVANGNYVFFADDRAELTTLDIYHDTPTVVKTADKYIVHSGDEVTYTLTVSNTSPNALTSLNLSDVISAGTTYVTGSATGGGSYNSVDKKVTWTIPSLPASGQAGATMTVTFRVTID